MSDTSKRGGDGPLDRRALDRLANDVRSMLADSERIVYSLLLLYLDEAEQTDLADAIDEIFVAPER